MCIRDRQEPSRRYREQDAQGADAGGPTHVDDTGVAGPPLQEPKHGHHRRDRQFYEQMIDKRHGLGGGESFDALGLEVDSAEADLGRLAVGDAPQEPSGR